TLPVSTATPVALSNSMRFASARIMPPPSCCCSRCACEPVSTMVRMSPSAPCRTVASAPDAFIVPWLIRTSPRSRMVPVLPSAACSMRELSALTVIGLSRSLRSACAGETATASSIGNSQSARNTRGLDRRLDIGQQLQDLGIEITAHAGALQYRAGAPDRRRLRGFEGAIAGARQEVARFDVDRADAALAVALELDHALQLHQRAVAVDPG